MSLTIRFVTRAELDDILARSTPSALVAWTMRMVEIEAVELRRLGAAIEANRRPDRRWERTRQRWNRKHR